MLGNGRLEAQCIDGTKRLCHIRGKMRKKVWVNMVRPAHTLGAPDLWRCRGLAHLALQHGAHCIVCSCWPH